LGVATLRARVPKIWFGVLLIAFPIMLTAFSQGLMIPWIIEQGHLEIVGRVSQIVNGMGWGIFWLFFGYALLTRAPPSSGLIKSTRGQQRAPRNPVATALT